MAHDWQAIESKTVSIKELIDLAANLKCEDGVNREYDRALAEIIVDASGLSMSEAKLEVARRIGIKSKIG